MEILLPILIVSQGLAVCNISPPEYIFFPANTANILVYLCDMKQILYNLG